MNKKILIPALSLALLGLTAFGVTSIKAQGDGNYPPIVQKLVERFGLNEGEVQQVFDEARGERQEQMKAKFEERLEQAVADGKITAEQKQLILAKQAEMQANRGQWQDLTPEERKAKMGEHKEEMKTWAEENGLDLSQFKLIGPGGGMKGGFGHGLKK